MSTPSDPKMEAWHAMLIAHNRATKEIERRLAKAKQVSNEVYDVLVTLEYQPDQKLRMADLADKVLFSRSGLTRLVDRMEKQGLIKRETCEDDRRGSYAVLTPKGRRAREDAWEILRPTVEELWSTQILNTEHAECMKEIFLRVATLANPNDPNPHNPTIPQ